MLYYSYRGKGHQSYQSYLAVRKSAAALDNEGWGGEVEMVSDGQNWEMGAGELRRNRELKPFWGQTFLIGKDRTDSETVKNNLEIRQTDKPSLLTWPGSKARGSSVSLLLYWWDTSTQTPWRSGGRRGRITFEIFCSCWHISLSPTECLLSPSRSPVIILHSWGFVLGFLFLTAWFLF